MPAPSQKLLTVSTLEHFVLPFIRSYIAEGDFPPPSAASQMLTSFSRHISSILLIIASLSLIISRNSFIFSTNIICKLIFLFSWNSTILDTANTALYNIIVEFHNGE